MQDIPFFLPFTLRLSEVWLSGFVSHLCRLGLHSKPLQRQERGPGIFQTHSLCVLRGERQRCCERRAEPSRPRCAVGWQSPVGLKPAGNKGLGFSALHSGGSKITLPNAHPLQVTLIPTHDTEVTRDWYQQTHEKQQELNVMVLASSSTVVMQDESFPACKIEF